MQQYPRRIGAAVIAVGVLVTTAVGAFAGSSMVSPPHAYVQPAPMTRVETQLIMEAYLEALLGGGSYADFFADDILVTMMDTGQEARGREAAYEALNNLHEIAFDAAPEPRSIVYGDGIASAEIVFVGTQIGEFGDVLPTGGEVRVPYSVVWELELGKITDLRLYQLATGLTTQVTALGEAAGS